MFEEIFATLNWFLLSQEFMASIVSKSIKITFDSGWQEWLSHKDFPELQKTIDPWNGKRSNSIGAMKGIGEGNTVTKSSKKGGRDGHE